MSLVLQKSRKFQFEYIEKIHDDAGKEIDKVTASFNFEFPFSEDKEYSSIAKDIKERLIPDAKTDEDKEKNSVALNLLMTQARDKELRCALKSAPGVDMEVESYRDPTTEEMEAQNVTISKNSKGEDKVKELNIVPLIITKEDGSIDVDNQKVAFEFIKSQAGMMEKILCAKAGLSIKNL